MDELRTGYADTALTNGYEFTHGSGYPLPEYPFEAPAELAAGRVGDHPVVIVGAGLAGLTAACALASYGVPAVVLDEDNTVGVKGASSRGICYTQKSLEIFHRLGIYERIARKGIQWSVGRTFAGEDEVYSFDLRQQSDYNLSTQPPFINIQQFYIEGYLVERIRELGGVQLRWNNRVTGFEQDAGGATLSVSTPAGDYRIRAQHVIDATGCHSPFRQWVGASVTAKKGDDRWCIADVRFSKHPPVERHTWIEAPFNENRAVWQHLMGDKVWRIDYQMAPNADPEEVSREDVVRERLKRQFGADCEVEIVWVGPYAYRSECVDRDAPWPRVLHGRRRQGGQPLRRARRQHRHRRRRQPGLEAGRRPAGAGRRATLLDSYHEERHEAARQNVQVTNRTARFLRPGRRHREACSATRRWAWRASTRSRASSSTPAAWRWPTPIRFQRLRPHRRPVGAERRLRMARRLHGRGQRAAAMERRPVAAAAVRRPRPGRTVAHARTVGDGAAALRAGPGARATAGRGRTRARPARPPAGRMPCLRPCVGAAAARQLRRGHRRERGRQPGACHRPRTRHCRSRGMKLPTSMKTVVNFQDADTFYEQLLDAHQGLDRDQSELLNARLILLLANQVGDAQVLEECVEAAKPVRARRDRDRLRPAPAPAWRARRTGPASGRVQRGKRGRRRSRPKTPASR